MKTLLKIGLAAVALLPSTGTLAVPAGGDTLPLYALTDLGPGFAFNANNPDDDGRFLVVGGTIDLDGTERATVWTLAIDGTIEDVFVYDASLGNSQGIDVNDDGMVVISSDAGFFVDVPGVGLKSLPGAFLVFAINNHGVVAGSVFNSTTLESVGAVWQVGATGAVAGPVFANPGPNATFGPSDVNDHGTLAGIVLTNDSITAAIAEFDHNAA